MQRKCRSTVLHTFKKDGNVLSKHCAVTRTDDTHAPEHVQLSLEYVTIQRQYHVKYFIAYLNIFKCSTLLFEKNM